MLQCASSWAFAAISTIEAVIRFTQNTSTLALSEQQLLDCAGVNCSSGNARAAYDYAIGTGVVADSSYKYSCSSDTCASRQQSSSSSSTGGNTNSLSPVCSVDQVLGDAEGVSIGAYADVPNQESYLLKVGNGVI